MSKQPDDQQFGRRERQIMAVVFRLGEASVAEVKQHLADLSPQRCFVAAEPIKYLTVEV